MNTPTSVGIHPEFDDIWEYAVTKECMLPEDINQHQNGQVIFNNDWSKFIQVWKDGGIYPRTINPDDWYGYQFSKCFPYITSNDCSGKVWKIDTKQLFLHNILDMRCIESNDFPYSEKILVILKEMGVTPKYGEIVHIPVYDIYDSIHEIIIRFIIVFDGEKFLKTNFDDMSDYGTLPDQQFYFPKFDVDYFPNGVDGKPSRGCIWVQTSFLQNVINNGKYLYKDKFNMCLIEYERRYFMYNIEDPIPSGEFTKCLIDIPTKYNSKWKTDFKYTIVLSDW